LDHETEDTAIVTSIVKLAGAVDVHVVAEGVESWSAWSRGAVDSQFPW
jgi:EAL domain-containing protein (putative c-di-GMP-specific phosphodiesterase class I)